MRPEEPVDRNAIEARQATRLSALLAAVHGRNPFYTRKLTEAGIMAGSNLRADLAALPFTTKAELVADQQAHPPWGTALTEPLGHYTRYCQTSSTTGTPLRWIDTTDSWQWALECWKAVYRDLHIFKTPGSQALHPNFVSGVLPASVRCNRYTWWMESLMTILTT